MNSKIIAVDFDGTLCENKWPEIGEANEDMIYYLRKRQAEGDKLILWTCRVGDMLRKAINWCYNYGLIFNAVNENLPEIIDSFGSDTRKIFANEYIDDRNRLISSCREKSNMELWVENEVRIACEHERKASGTKEEEQDYGCACFESALKAYRSLLEDGHSGFSIGMTKYILVRMIERKPLTPIVDTEDVWSDARDRSGDRGEVVNYHYQNADADIEAETTLEYENEHRFSHSEKKYTDAKKKAFYIKIGNYFGILGGWKNHYQEAEIYTSEWRLKIGEHFYIPISFGVKEIRQYESKEKVYTQEEMRILLSEEFQLFCKELEEKKIEILQKDVKIYLQENSAKAKGTLRIQEKIGQHNETEMIDF